jgi:hypothetical protein
VIDPALADRIAPGANGIFRPLIVTGGQITGTWERSLRRRELTVTLHPFPGARRDLVEAAQREAARYRAFLGADAGADPVVLAGPPEA